MTPEEFIDKFPNKTTVNDGLLADIACPQCGEREQFRVSFVGVANVTDDSSEDDGDHEWDDASEASCSNCDMSGDLSDFRIKGLDEVLEDKQKAENEDDEEDE